MSRPKREWYPGAVYHIMSRGNRKSGLYNEADDYLFFLDELLKIKELYRFRIHSLCLMTNHFHLLLETSDVEVWRIMSRLLHSHAMRFNIKYHYTGHLFENRYVSCLVEDEKYFVEASRYIHLNPVKARMVVTPAGYEYSSYRKFVGTDDTMHRRVNDIIGEIVDTDKVLASFDNDSRLYEMFVNEHVLHSEHESLIQKDMKEDEMGLPI